MMEETSSVRLLRK
jgi:hypothetical protein